MVIKYIYKEKEYTNVYSLVQDLWKDSNVLVSIPQKNIVEFWKQHGITYVEEPDPEPTEEELLEQAKYERAKQVAAIKVEVDGMTFDGDETSQSRMARAITAAETAGMDTTVWVLADNTVATVTKAQLQQALAKAMLAMAELWTVPYEKDPTEEEEVGLAKVGI